MHHPKIQTNSSFTSHPTCLHKTVQLYQTNRKENQEAHAAKQHNHSQSNHETEIKNKHSNKHNKPNQSKPPAN
jgi:hypothetical protein